MQKIVLLVCLMTSIASRAQEPDFKISEVFPIEAEHSYVGFSVQYMGYAMVRGRFTDFKGSVRFNEKDLSKTSVSLRVDVGSIDTGNQWRDEDLRTENWFEQKKYPTLEFTSTTVTPAGPNLSVTGDLTVHGITKTITFPMTCTPRVVKDVREDSQIIFTGTLQLDRTVFGVEGKKWAGIKEGITAVSDIVNIELTILGKRINAPNFRYWVANTTTPHGRIYKIAMDKGVAAALHTFDSLKAVVNNGIDVETLNTVGQMFLKLNRTDEAIALFRRNIAVFSEHSLVYESYGEVMATLGNWTEARKYYELALAKDPGNMNVKEILRHVPH